MRRRVQRAFRVRCGPSASHALWLLCALTACDAIDADRLNRTPHDPPPAVVDASDGIPDSGRPPQAGSSGVPLLDGGASECTGALASETCSRPHAKTTCIGEQCLIVECDAPWLDCNVDPEDGCEATLDDVDNCGLCGKSCALPNAEVACKDRQCELSRCEPGFGDCDDDASTGCETPLDTVVNCGACANVCGAVDNGVPGCIDGECGVLGCIGPFGDCNEDVDDGCEQSLATDDYCARCDAGCDPDNGEGTCSTGQCAVTSCDGSFEDCNGLADDGCEGDLTSVEHCGACGATCELPLHASAVKCGAGSVCLVDHACPSGASGCTDDAPETGCEEGYADCDGLGANGCETELGTLTDCGGCGDQCDEPFAINECNDGSCEWDECLPGYEDCGSGSCLWLGLEEATCGQCDTSCGGGTPECFGGECTSQICPIGTADCDGSGGCEVTVNTTSACGVCGLSCGPYSHAGAACSNYRCALSSCTGGFLDCDGQVHNGCEVDGRTLDACAACGSVCSIPHAQESCDDGSCELVECDEGRADCNDDLDDGCEASLLLPTSCGDCDNDCTGRPHTQAGGCDDGECKLICEPGYRDCNQDSQDGCEAVLGSPEHCGSCDNDCTDLPNVADASCGTETCEELVCDEGYADCDGLANNGCERSIRTDTDCGGCDEACAVPNAEASCASGSCRLTECTPGFADCNAEDDDGCEASLAAPETCGSCDRTCEAGMQCDNGMCRCDDDADCVGAGESCCDGTCTFTQSACFPFPCIPGTTVERQNCAGCGMECALWCCAVP
jgi:hypothetical protein